MKRYSPSEAKHKIQRYCAYQERSHQEVRNKLYSYGLGSRDVDAIMVDLLEDNFLNEERFAKAFAGGKFRMKKWGRIKIAHALEEKGVSANCITIGLREIDASDYENAVREFIEDRAQHPGDDNVFARRDRISKAAMMKGYEADLVWRLLKEIIPDQR